LNAGSSGAYLRRPPGWFAAGAADRDCAAGRGDRGFIDW